LPYWQVHYTASGLGQCAFETEKDRRVGKEIFYDGQLRMQGGFRIWRSRPNRLRGVGDGTKREKCVLRQGDQMCSEGVL